MPRVTLYGSLADRLGRHVALDGGAMRVAAIRTALAGGRPELEEALSPTRAKAWIGDTLADEGREVGADEAIDFFPPVSGG